MFSGRSQDGGRVAVPASESETVGSIRPLALSTIGTRAGDLKFFRRRKKFSIFFSVAN